jgi:SOS-response transcriptional repressor LexA
MSRILNGKIENPTERQVAPLAKFFGVTGDQLRGNAPLSDDKRFDVAARGAQAAFQANEARSGYDSNVSPGPRLKGMVPVINWVQAGAWTDICDEAFDTQEEAPRPPGSSDRTFALRVRGQSMLPKYEPGLIIYVDPEAMPYDGDDVVALMVDDNEATLKQLVEEPGGQRLLKARNPSWPEPWVTINGNCEIVGVVVGSLWLRTPRP